MEQQLSRNFFICGFIHILSGLLRTIHTFCKSQPLRGRSNFAYSELVRLIIHKWDIQWHNSRQFNCMKDANGYQQHIWILTQAWNISLQPCLFNFYAEGVYSYEHMYQEPWRKVLANNSSDAEIFGLQIQQPRLVKLYYNICAEIYRHKKQCQDDLQLQHTVKRRH